MIIFCLVIALLAVYLTVATYSARKKEEERKRKREEERKKKENCEFYSSIANVGMKFLFNNILASTPKTTNGETLESQLLREIDTILLNKEKKSSANEETIESQMLRELNRVSNEEKLEPNKTTTHDTEKTSRQIPVNITGQSNILNESINLNAEKVLDRYDVILELTCTAMGVDKSMRKNILNTYHDTLEILKKSQ